MRRPPDRSRSGGRSCLPGGPGCVELRHSGLVAAVLGVPAPRRTATRDLSDRDALDHVQLTDLCPLRHSNHSSLLLNGAAPTSKATSYADRSGEPDGLAGRWSLFRAPSTVNVGARNFRPPVPLRGSYASSTPSSNVPASPANRCRPCSTSQRPRLRRWSSAWSSLECSSKPAADSAGRCSSRRRCSNWARGTDSYGAERLFL